MVALARALKAEHDRGARLGLRDDERSFYDAVCQHDSAVLGLGDDTLKKIARALVAAARENTTATGTRRSRSARLSPS